MMPLAPADRTKLAAVLNLLGSPHQGEVAAAAAAADRLVRGRGLNWRDVLGSDEPPNAKRFAQPPASPYSPGGGHLRDLAICEQRLDLLTAWEREFVASLSQRRTVSAKQRRILADIVAKVLASGPRAG